MIAEYAAREKAEGEAEEEGEERKDGRKLRNLTTPL